MKCKSCGAAISLEDQFCSHCGAANEEAKKHLKDMEHYNNEFDQTRTEVITKTKRWTDFTLSIAVISVLLLLNAVALLMHSKSYVISDFIENIVLISNKNEHLEKLDNYEKNEEYYELAAYETYYSLYLCDVFDDYDAVMDACDAYTSIYNSIMDLQNKDGLAIYTIDSQLSSISFELSNLYRISPETPYKYKESAFSDIHTASLEKIRLKVENLITYYCNLTEEEILSLPNMGDLEKTNLIGRGLGVIE